MKELSTWVDGLRVRYRDSGASGPTVLMLHGIGGSLDLWASQYVVANAGLRLVSLDLPSHGLSDFSARPWSPLDYARFVWRFVDELGLSAGHLTGNSMGGAIALRMLGEQPGRVKSVLLAAAATLGR
ncbi:MAG TPA: alpha/beta fold hydrolase, partial [Burkholderiaceae bacterium]|nr:alpha/beta fold hydrolase [Burkholderiaceae bacterium]